MWGIEIYVFNGAESIPEVGFVFLQILFWFLRMCIILTSSKHHKNSKIPHKINL